MVQLYSCKAVHCPVNTHAKTTKISLNYSIVNTWGQLTPMQLFHIQLYIVMFISMQFTCRLVTSTAAQGEAGTARQTARLMMASNRVYNLMKILLLMQFCLLTVKKTYNIIMPINKHWVESSSDVSCTAVNVPTNVHALFMANYASSSVLPTYPLYEPYTVVLCTALLSSVYTSTFLLYLFHVQLYMVG